MNPKKVRDALYFLRPSHSFLCETWHSKDSVLVQHQEFIEQVLRSRPEDVALGIYVNNVEVLDCLIITTNGIFSIYKTRGRFVPFASIRKIYAPQPGDQALDIELSDNEFETIAVLGETGDIPDIYAFESFLQYLIKYPSPDIFDELKSVETKEDLVTLMEKHFGKNCGSETQSRIESFEDEFVQNNIDPAIKQAKGFWRLIGLWRIDDALLSDSDDDY